MEVIINLELSMYLYTYLYMINIACVNSPLFNVFV